ncbi:HoxN/HupN/NixA family nickel/cobalt transporter [Convivina intestini]|uniref:HoxN/HupN/NixA family nickel/cobalt transporter n=1 Tax=Convivina intestini TaxID=1505726 RepID=UPI00200F128D|nr:HoxN/HupN/NixA family nickel/cobalt transporter [Convivina intestini]CAH1850856.1 Nickel transporter NixA [Convivina intestini]
MTKANTFKNDVIKYGTFILLILVAGIILLGSGMGQYPEIIGMAVLSFTFGLRHAFDVDHIAAIDNMTRKMLNDGKNTRGVGFSFSFGHSMVVVLMALATVVFVEWAKNSMPIFENIGGAFGTMIAGVMLFFLTVVNTFILFSIWRNFKKINQQAQNGQTAEEFVPDSKIYTWFTKMLQMIQHNWQVGIVGFLFGLGFDTATQIAVLATSATATSAGIAWYTTLAFPLLFTAGMCLMDTMDGFFMSTTYNWIISSSYRKVYYNLILTSISVLAAGFISFVDFTQSFSAIFGWNNGLTNWASSLDFNQLGIILVIIFVVVWTLALTIWRVMNLSEREITD